MRKIYLFMMVSLDGYFEGENHDLSWHNVDAEFNEYAIHQTKNLGVLLFGRYTYDLMSGYWPTEKARKDDPVVAELMNNKPKIVFSRTMQKLPTVPNWKNATLKGEIVKEEIEKLKQGADGDIGIYGSNKLCVSMMEMGLVDEFRIMVNPVAIGKGTPVFNGLKQKHEFKLLDSQTFKNGNVLLSYRSVK